MATQTGHRWLACRCASGDRVSQLDWWEPGGLDAWRLVGDPLADAVVEVLANLDEKPQMESSLGFVERMAANSELSAEQRRPLREFLQVNAQPPDWLDWGSVLRGQTFFVRYGVVHSTALLLGGLLESYSDTQIANVLPVPTQYEMFFFCETTLVSFFDFQTTFGENNLDVAAA